VKRIDLLITVAALASFAWIAPARAARASAASPQASAAQKPPREQPSQPPAPQEPNNAQQPDQPQAGSQGENQRQTVMLTGHGEYVLSDSGVNYRLDQQGKAKRFEGQKVKVMGTLDMATNMIHVSLIEPAA
jgi:Protein of unknown function (DUF5818)